MSVTGYSYNINATKKLNELEIAEGFEGNRSWHHQFKDSAYVYIGGLDTRLTEGDVVIMFSQFGEIVDVNMVRDKATGKSKGFCFICFEDQRSTILAVDNMNGFKLLGRDLRVDHVAKYKAPKQLDENDLDEEGNPKLLEYNATGAEGKGQGVYNIVDGQKKIAEVEAQRRKPSASQGKPEDEDEAWAKSFEESLKRSNEADEAKQALKKLKKQKEEIRRMKEEAKRLKSATKKTKKEGKKVKKEKKAASKVERGEAGKALKKKSKVKSESPSSERSSASSDDSG